MRNKLAVYITIDTETSIGGAWDGLGPPLDLTRPVLGKLNGREYGVSLIMDLLEEQGFRGTFFVEMFCTEFVGIEALARVCEAIRKRGHDVQLHLHPVYRFYLQFVSGMQKREQDLMFQLPPEEQRELIRDGVRIFQQVTGSLPRAYRAGCYGASEITLAALRENGVAIDSSYNLAFLGTTCGFRTPRLNAPAVLEGVYEFPVTNFVSGIGEGYKPLEISAVSVSEIMATLKRLHAAGCQDAVLVFHSFSFLKRRNPRYEECRPDRIVIQRFRNLCKALGEMRDVIDVQTLGGVDLSRTSLAQPQVVPSLGWVTPGLRKAVQAVNYIPWI